MSRSRTFRVLLMAVLAGLAVGCQDPATPNQFFAFVRPQHLAFACYDTFNEGFGPNLTESVERPLACCGKGRAEDDSAYCGTSPRLHGLVSQTRRGEVAAVNLEPDDGEDSVVDSDPTIPGFTFTDVGELPAALVIPKVDLVDERCGPRWAFVASAGDREVRAVATCRFRRGISCGPEAALNGAGADLAALTRISLGTEPGDMVFDDDGYLWISLPEQDALGRIRINDGSAIVDAGGSLDAPGCAVAGETLASPSDADAVIAVQRPFLPDADGSALELFPLDDTLPTVALAAVDDDGYSAQCGLGTREDALGDRILEPYASELLADGGLDAGADGGDAGADGGLDAGADGGLDAGADGGLDAGADGGGVTSRVSPKRLRYDARTGLLLASDLARPLLHAWNIRGETPTPVASIVTGAPVRDFVVTGPVPASVDLYTRDGSDVAPNDTFSDDEVRYIYAIDDRDGSVLAIRWTPEASGQDTVELVRPRGRVPKADRLYVGNGLAQTLEVIDTRSNTLRACGNPDFEAYDEGRTVRDLVPGSILRGVYVVVALSTGGMTFLDVHDEDLFCEAFGYTTENADGGVERVEGRCQDSDPREPNRAQARLDGDDADPIGLSVRRHSIRLEQAEAPDGRGDTDDLGAIECPDGYLVLDQQSDRGGVLTSGGSTQDNSNTFCINQDPSMQVAQDWVVTYEGLLPVPASAEGYFEPGASSAESARFQLTPGFDLCTRGVADADALDEEQAYPGDYLVLPKTPPAGAPDGCELDPQDDPPRFPILEAYEDHLIVGARVETDTRRMSLRRAIECFGPNNPADAGATAPGITSFDVSVRGRHLVQGTSLGVLSRMKSDADSGRCVLDSARDPRLRSRVRVASSDAQCAASPFLFQNPYVAFCPRRPQGSTERNYRLTVDVSRAPTPLLRTLSGGLGGAVLPVTLRYQAETRQLFVVDSAEQGLLQWDIRPLPLSRTESYR